MHKWIKLNFSCIEMKKLTADRTASRSYSIYVSRFVMRMDMVWCSVMSNRGYSDQIRTTAEHYTTELPTTKHGRMRWSTCTCWRRCSVVARVQATWLTESARKVLVDIWLYVTSEVRQYDASVTDVLCTSRLLLLLLLMMMMMMTAMLVVVQ